MRLRIFVSTAIGVASGLLVWYLLRHFHERAGDFDWTIWAAQDLLARRNSYDRVLQHYPMPTAFFGLPFVRVPFQIAGGIFYGLSSALMSFGLSRYGYHRLIVFLAYPYWAGLTAVQWSPMIFASAFFPLLLPAILVKPQIGLPVAITYPNRRGYVACVVLLALSLLLARRWPISWLANLHDYERFIPLLLIPGPFLVLALLRYRDRDARLLFLMAVMPQRWFYDGLVLWLIPKSRREILATVTVSWFAGIWRWYHSPQSYDQAGRWMVWFMYLPMLAVVLARSRHTQSKSEAATVCEATTS